MKGYFRKRGTKWSFTVDVGIDTVTGKRRQITKSGFTTKKEAQEVCAGMIVEITNGSFITPKKTTMEGFAQDFLNIKKSTLKESTHYTYESLIKNHIVSFFGKTKLQDITPQDINRLYSSLLTKVSSATVRDIHKVLNLIFNQAIDYDLIKKSPMTIIKKPALVKKELKVWNAEQFKKFLDVVKEHRLYIVFHLALATGMRQSEILGLRWKDVDFENGTIRVVQTLSHDGKKLTPTTKTKNSLRTITVDNTTLDELKRHKEDLKEETDLVITSLAETPQTPRRLLRVFEKYVNITGLPKITFHDLRHTHATLLLSEGINPKVVAERLGHADMRTTLEIYSHVLPTMQKEVSNKLSKFF